jgi:voltage-gated potassium channel
MDRGSLRGVIHDVIFRHERPAEKAFDVLLILAILASVLVVLLDSVPGISAEYGPYLHAAEWAFTILFTLEYLLRLWAAERTLRYAKSFFGVVDLLALLPTYLSLLFPAGRFLFVLRVVRVLRVFRILKLTRYVDESAVLATAVRASRYKIAVFVLAVSAIVVVVGSVMYLIEGPEAGFTSIPQSMYWAIVTLTTVGYGDITPVSPPGKFLAAALMVLGYGIIAVPTGIVTLELNRASQPPRGVRACPRCRAAGHDEDASYCNHCGSKLSSSHATASDPLEPEEEE